MHRQVQIIEYQKSFVTVQPVADDRARQCCGNHCPLTMFSRLLRVSSYRVPVTEYFAPQGKANLHIDDNALLYAAYRHYGLPLLVLLMSALVGSAFGWSDFACAGFSIAMYILCQLWLIRMPMRISSAKWYLTHIKKGEKR